MNQWAIIWSVTTTKVVEKKRMECSRPRSEYEVEKIDALLRLKKSHRCIADFIKQSKRSITNYAKRKRIRRAFVDHPEDHYYYQNVRSVLWYIKHEKEIIFRKLMNETGIQVSYKTVRLVLFEDTTLEFRKFKPHPKNLLNHIKSG